MNLKKDTYTLDEARRKLEGYCAYQERCNKEVRQKLKEMGMIPMAMESIIAHLIQENYLNEARFAQSFTHGKFHIKKWGKNRILAELKNRDISFYNIELALREIDEETYSVVLRQLAKKRISQLKEDDIQKKRRKLADYLLYRGWESDRVYAITKELIP